MYTIGNRHIFSICKKQGFSRRVCYDNELSCLSRTRIFDWQNTPNRLCGDQLETKKSVYENDNESQVYNINKITHATNKDYEHTSFEYQPSKLGGFAFNVMVTSPSNV